MVEPFDNQSISCQEVLQYLCEYLGDDEDSARCQAVKEHIEHCPDCAAYCNSLDTMVGLYRMVSPSFSPEARKSLLKSLGLDHAQ